MSILAIDRWKKRLGLAYTSGKHGVIFPIGSVDNKPDMFYDIAHIVAQHNPKVLLVGMPSQESYVTKKIQKFIHDLKFFISPDINIVPWNEDYTSVQASERLGTYKKTAAEDTLAAAIMIETYMAQQSNI